MNLRSSDWCLLVAGLLFALALIGCSVRNDSYGLPHIDTNGYYSKPEDEHMKYCQRTKGTVIYFVPCSEIKHDINL